MASKIPDKSLFREEADSLIELFDKVILAPSLAELVEVILPGLIQRTGAAAAFLYLKDPRLCDPFFSQVGLQAEASTQVQSLCAEHLGKISAAPQVPSEPVALIPSPTFPLTVGAVCCKGKSLGLLGLLRPEAGMAAPGQPVPRLLPLLGHAICSLLDRLALEKQTKFLNTYLTVSSMIAQCLDLSELLETVLSCVMETVSAEEASLLLLDEDQVNFEFHIMGGPSQEVLKSSTFPADRGIAGAVLQTQESEVINNVHQDPRFYGKIDSDSGVVTRNMMAIPLTAGEEKIGVMEVLNKSGGEPFTNDERLLLESIAEEIAFAIRNAKIFEYVINSYCKRRQGETSCKGCKRPLKSWTPCVKYLEKSL
jgi:GAF domain-containing protein